MAEPSSPSAQKVWKPERKYNFYLINLLLNWLSFIDI